MISTAFPASGHQILAVNRGEKEGWLKVSMDIDGDAALGLVWREFVKPGSSATEIRARRSGGRYDRLLCPLWSAKSETPSPIRGGGRRSTTSRST
jgi:hypothetical protein